MGKVAETTDTETEELEPQDVIEELEEELEQDADSTPEGSEGEGAEQETGLDLSLDEETQPQNDENAWIRERINRANKKVDKALQGKTEAEQRAELLEEQNRLKDLRIQQLEGKAPATEITKPDPEKFDGGIYDPEFIKAHDEYTEARLKKLADEVKAEAAKKYVDSGNQAEMAKQVERDQTKHYERAFKLQAKDYAETEDKAREFLGESDAKAIMSLSDASELVLYYFGKNESKARDFAYISQTNPRKALLELGRLEEKLKGKVGSKSKTTTTTDPDEEIEGSINPAKKLRGPKGATFE